MALSLELIGAFYYWRLSNQLSCILFIFFSSFFCNSIPCSGWLALCGVNPGQKTPPPKFWFLIDLPHNMESVDQRSFLFWCQTLVSDNDYSGQCTKKTTRKRWRWHQISDLLEFLIIITCELVLFEMM